VVSESVLASVEGYVGVLTLNRPERRNALTLEMRARLSQMLNEYEADRDVRVVILQGAPPAFCAGVDLSESSSPDAGVLADVAASVGAPIAAFSKPLIASVNGAAAGGGLEIALACDFIIASTTAKFLLPEVRLGSLPGGGGTQRLTRIVSRGVAARMLYTGDTLDAANALAYGLVTELVEPEALEARTMALASQIAANAPLSLAAIKQCLQVAANSPLDVGLAVERGLWGQLANTEDRAEGRAAFREKRPPHYKGK
jgi:enoyl-CoA hydratase/carnithine racemase